MSATFRLIFVPLFLAVSFWHGVARSQATTADSPPTQNHENPVNPERLSEGPRESEQRKLLVNPYAVADSPLIVAYQGLNDDETIEWLIESDGQEQLLSTSGFEQLVAQGEVIFHPQARPGEYVIRAIIRRGEESLFVVRASVKVLPGDAPTVSTGLQKLARAQFISDDQTDPFGDSPVGEAAETSAESSNPAPMPIAPPASISPPPGAARPTPTDPPTVLLPPTSTGQATAPLRLTIPATGERKEEFLQQTRQRMIALRLTLEPRFLQHAEALGKSFKKIAQDPTLTDTPSLLKKVTAASLAIIGPDQVPESVYRGWAQFLNNDSLAIAIANNIDLQSQNIEDYRRFYSLLSEALVQEAKEDTTTKLVAEYLVKKGFEPPGTSSSSSGSYRTRKHCNLFRH